MDKPRFYYMDLENYTDDFLREIILWQKEEIERLEIKQETKPFISQVKMCRDTEFKDIPEVLEMENKVGFMPDDNDYRPGHRIWIDRKDAERLYSLFRRNLVPIPKEVLDNAKAICKNCKHHKVFHDMSSNAILGCCLIDNGLKVCGCEKFEHKDVKRPTICDKHGMARKLSENGYCQDCGDYPFGKGDENGNL